MKKIALTVLWVTGICLAGADVTGSFGHQVITCTIGVVIFAISSLLLINELE